MHLFILGTYATQTENILQGMKKTLLFKDYERVKSINPTYQLTFNEHFKEMTSRIPSAKRKYISIGRRLIKIAFNFFMKNSNKKWAQAIKNIVGSGVVSLDHTFTIRFVILHNSNLAI